MQNFIKLSAAFHELSCWQTFFLYLATVINPKTQSWDLDRWPMPFTFSGVPEHVKTNVRAKFHQAKCCGSWVIMLTERIIWTNIIRKRLGSESLDKHHYSFMLWAMCCMIYHVSVKRTMLFCSCSSFWTRKCLTWSMRVNIDSSWQTWGRYNNNYN